MIGYSGTGYKGMQLAPDQKTIEGDIFKAFVDAGAISKANADDPKKSSFVRCARTDKGVHAAGNIISLKLITEEEDIVKKINDALTPQIRVWGFERTNNGFSCYQLCDSRIYEYLIPTHSLLPPHPSSFLGRKCREWAERRGDLEKWDARQEEVKGYWEKVDETMIKPILEEYPEDIRNVLEKALWMSAEKDARAQEDKEDQKTGNAVNSAQNGHASTDNDKNSVLQTAKPLTTTQDTAPEALTAEEERLIQEAKDKRKARRQTIEEGVKRLRAAYVSAKRAYRVPDVRKERLQSVLELYIGTRNFWNYTIQKGYKDPSAKRVMKSFKVNPQPILIDGTEWLSLKVHGQSFMMHQIRKMVGMAALVVRCGCIPERVVEAYGPTNISIPKAPSLGLLLERPVFDSYNKRAKTELNREPIDFDKYKDEMEKFKQEFIYNRMYHDEERENVFGNFFNHVDNFPSNTFLFVTSGGLDACREADGPETGAMVAEKKHHADADGESEDEDFQNSKNELVDSDDELDEIKDNAGDEG